MQGPPDPPARPHVASVLRSATGFRRLLVASVLVLVAVAWAAWYEVARHDREQALAAAARRQGNLIIAVGHYLQRALSNADALALFLARAHATPGSDMAGTIADRARANELFREMVLCEEDGRSTSSHAGASGDGRRAWCAAWLRSAPPESLNFPDVPVEEGEETLIPLLTRVPAAAGRPAGVLALLVEIRRLMALMQDYSIPDETIVLLFGPDGAPRVRWHSETRLDDQRAPEAELLTEVMARGELGQLHAVRGRARIVSARAMADRPLVIMVATDLAATLEEPDARALHGALAAGAATLLLPLFAWLLLRLQSRIVGMASALGDAQGRLQEANTQLEQEVRARTAQLEQAYGELETFSYTVAHDVRAPIATIAGFAGALEPSLRSLGDARALHYLRRIQANAAQMEQLTGALLALGKLSRVPLELAPVDLSALAQEVLAGLREQDAARIVAIEVQQGIAVLGDRVLLRQVLENVLGNAWKFSARRARSLVQVRAERGPEAGWTTVTVQDNGEGFDAASVHDPFKPFQRMHAAGDFPGSGVGLATVDRIVRLHGGRAWIRSRPEEGTAVSFTLRAA